MAKSFFVRMLVCIFVLGILLYAHIAKQNSITQLRLTIPKLTKELEAISQENHRLQFELASKQSPQQLLLLHQSPSFSHLKYPNKTNCRRLDET